MNLRFSSIFLVVLTSQAFAAYIPKEIPKTTAPGKFYISAFGGGGSSDEINASMYGTAFFTEAQGGPLAVHAFGVLGDQSGAIWGGQVGYQAPAIVLSPSSPFTLGAAIELEAYAMDDQDYSADLFNDTDRLPEHDFLVTYPLERGVFLANVILSFNHSEYPVHPYVGVGFGQALLEIEDATAAQVDPLEADINHYNVNGTDRDTVFAGQIKVGLSVDVNEYISIFADYRWLYVAHSQFVLGGTSYPTHVPTSTWDIALDNQHYNLGSLGIKLSA